MHFKVFCCAMQKTNLLVAFASYAALLSAAMLCAAIDIEAQRRSNETLSHRSHRLVKTLHHCFVQQTSYKRDAAGTIHLLIVRSAPVLQFVCFIARKLKL